MGDLWSKIRKDFPVTSKNLYLDHAAGSPTPKPVMRAIAEQHELNANYCDLAWPKWIKKREAVRKKIAKFIHAEPEEVTFVNGTSDGMNHIADLLINEGAVLTNTSEFPSSTIPWVWRKAKIIWQKKENAYLSLEKLKALLTPQVKTILTSYVQYNCGFKQDLEALGEIKGRRYLVVNGTQAFGALPIHVKKWNADFFVTNSYKWMMAGYGGGVLYIKKSLLNKFRPHSVGWRSARNPDLMNNRKMDLSPLAMRYELGCPNFPVIYGMGAAVDYFSEIGVHNIEKRILSLTDYLVEKLEAKGLEIISNRDRKHKSGIVVFKIEKGVELWRKLLSKNIFVSLRGGGMRVAPHFYNNEDDLKRLIKELP